MKSNLFNGMGAPGALITLVGGSFLLLGLLIVIFPDLLAYLVGAFLFFDGTVLLGLGIRTRKIEKRYRQKRGEDIWYNLESF